MALVMAPIRSLATLGIVLEWNEPSRVIWHLTLKPVPWKESSSHVTLMFWVDMERFLAEAVLRAVASISAAANAITPSFADLRMKDTFHVTSDSSGAQGWPARC